RGAGGGRGGGDGRGGGGRPPRGEKGGKNPRKWWGFFPRRFGPNIGQAGNVAAGPCQVRHQTRSNGITGNREDRNFPRRLLRSQGAGCEDRRNDVDLATNQFLRQPGKPVRVSIRRTKLERIALSLDKPKLAQPFAELLAEDASILVRQDKCADSRHLRLLRARHARRRKRHGRAAEQRDKVAASHSITSSARARSDVGTMRPSALAVGRLITSSSLVG